MNENFNSLCVNDKYSDETTDTMKVCDMLININFFFFLLNDNNVC